MSEPTVNVDGVEVPLWAERSACLLAYHNIKVIAVGRDADTGSSVLTVRSRRTANKERQHAELVPFASFVCWALRHIGFTVSSADVELPPGHLGVHAQYDAAENLGEVFILGMSDAMFPPLCLGAAWLGCDVDAAPPTIPAVSAGVA